MHSDLLKKFAADLKTAREDKQISLNQIAAKTRIDLKYLAAIENANFDVLPELYIRAFIKEFAQFVDLNPEETIKKFDLARSGKVDAPEETVKDSTSAAEKIRRSTRTVSKQFESEDIEPYNHSDEAKKSIDPRILYGVIGAGVFLIIIAIYFIFFKSTTIEKDSTASQQGNVAETKKYEEQPMVQQNNIPAGDSLQLKIIATDLVWFQVTPDGGATKQFLFKDQQSTVVMAKTQFTLNLGNAGGVKLILNGKALDAAGRQGDVKNIVIDKEGIKPLTLERPKNERAPAQGN